MKKIVLCIGLLIALTYIAIKPLFIQGFFPMHDDTQPARVFEMAHALQDGLFPVRWVEHLGYGYGYPIFNFYAPLAYYAGSAFMLIGFDALIATKIIIGVAIIAAGITMFFFARELWGNAGGVISGLLYAYAPYHAVNIYVRGDLAEAFAYSFIPLVFLALYKLYVLQKKKSPNDHYSKWVWISVGALSFAGVVTSHNLTALMVTPFVLATGIAFLFRLGKAKKHGALTLFAPFLIGLLLSAFYWLPVPFEMHYTNVLSQVGGKADYRLHFVCPLQLWDSPWGFGGSASGCMDGMSYRIGKLHMLLVLFSAILIPFRWKRNREQAAILLALGVMFVLSVLLTTELSKLLWDTISLMAFFQYPWRFLLLASFFASVIGGSVVWFVRSVSLPTNLKYAAISIVSLGIILVGSLLYPELFIPQTILQKEVSDYTDERVLKWKISKISDEYLPKGLTKPTNESEVVLDTVFVLSNPGNVSVDRKKTNEITARITVRDSTEVLIHRAYFPAWHLYVNNNREQLATDSKGMRFSLPAGEHHIVLRLVQTPIEKLANIISLSGIVVLVVGIIRERRKIQR